MDLLLKQAANALNCPLGVISCVDENRIFFLAKFGLDIEETTREDGLCGTAIYWTEPYILNDTTLDLVANKNSLVTEGGVRSYISVPVLSTKGYRLANFSLLDVEPRYPDASEIECLLEFAEIASNIIEHKISSQKQIAQIQGQAGQLRAILDSADYGFCLLDMDLNIQFLNQKAKESFSEIFGVSPNKDDDINRFVLTEHKELFNRLFHDARKGQKTQFELEVKESILSLAVLPIKSVFSENSGILIVSADSSRLRNTEFKNQNLNKILKDVAWKHTHEVRKHVANLLGLSQLMESKLHLQKPEKYAEKLRKTGENIDSEVKSLIKFLEDFQNKTQN
ncbi:MAG: GAF domain-containing protein [Luteibaculum sp.]